MNCMRLLSLAVAISLWLTSLSVSCSVLLPATLLLLFSATHKIFKFVATCCEIAWLGFAVALLRYVLGVRIVMHLDDVDLPLKSGDVLLSCNHRTRIDWMFIWGLAAAMGRLGGLKIVIASVFKNIPGFGWAIQCFGFFFMLRKHKDVDLATLRDGAWLHGGCNSLVALIFPEGTDLSDSNLTTCNEHRKQKGLHPRTQVLHPKTAGLATLWRALKNVATRREAPQPLLLDATIAYVDYIPGERPSEMLFFGKGRCCREVHIRLERMSLESSTDQQSLERLCHDSFDRKEERLSRFYAPCAQGFPPDRSAISEGTVSLSMESVVAASRSLLLGVVFMGCLHVALGYFAWRMGAAATSLAFVAACVSFHFVSCLTGGIDKVLLRGVPATSNAAQVPLLL